MNTKKSFGKILLINSTAKSGTSIFNKLFVNSMSESQQQKYIKNHPFAFEYIHNPSNKLKLLHALITKV